MITHSTMWRPLQQRPGVVASLGSLRRCLDGALRAPVDPDWTCVQESPKGHKLVPSAGNINTQITLYALQKVRINGRHH
ncbi:hypothetical protein RRG08_024874 [Elysia crispata]|uniref:Uncharacterized protein n=1 Tax=Elysia crispata TaxID=231223 RepID=A0AAE1CZL1_9GAST|nr:hypothetical protein RRG08_024874 [Elysia crispata]